MMRSQMPGCCGIAVISGLSVVNCKENLKEKEQECRNYGYTIALATTTNKQPVPSKALEEREWENIGTFRSRTTYNDITLWRKELTAEAVE